MLVPVVAIAWESLASVLLGIVSVALRFCWIVCSSVAVVLSLTVLVSGGVNSAEENIFPPGLDVSRQCQRLSASPSQCHWLFEMIC